MDRTQRGFTLIEVALAIVIGTILLAGAVVLYQQAKLSAGDSKAKEKVMAAAAVVEELGAQLGVYPDRFQLRARWGDVRPDWGLSPWGGSVGSNVSGDAFKGIEGVSLAPASFTDPWYADNYRSANYAGGLGYAVGASSETKQVTDYVTGQTFTFRGYVLAIWNQAGHDPCFPTGGAKR